MMSSSSVNKEMARKKGCGRMAHNIYHISTKKKKKEQTSKKQSNDQITPVSHH